MWRIVGYGQDTRSFPDGAPTFLYSRPSDRRIDGEVRIEIDGSAEGKPLQFAFATEARRNNGASEALSELAGSGLGADRSIESIMETLKLVAERSDESPTVTVYLNERIDGGPLCFAEASIYLKPAQLRDQAFIEERMAQYEAIKALPLACGYPHVETTTLGFRHDQAQRVTPADGSPVRHARQVHYESFTVRKPQGISFDRF